MNLRMMGGVAAITLCAALAGCQKPAPAVDTAKEEAAINAMLDAFNAAAKAKDADKLVAMDAADIRGYGGGGPDVTSKDEDLKATKAILGDPNYAFAIKAEHTEVAKSGDLAWQSGTWDGTFSDPKTKQAVKSSGHYVAAYRKDDQGAWKLAAVSTADAAGAAPAAAAPAAEKPAEKK